MAVAEQDALAARPEAKDALFMSLRPSVLLFDETYQNPVPRLSVKERADDWDYGAYSALIISRRAAESPYHFGGKDRTAPAGSYFVVDGRRRVEAVRLMRWDADPKFTLSSFVHTDWTPAHEAEMYVKIGIGTRHKTAAQIWRSRLAYGDAAATAVEAAVRSAGVARINAITTAESLLARGGPARFEAALRMIGACWQSSKSAVQADIMNGIFNITAIHGEALDVAIAQTRWAKVVPAVILREADGLSADGRRHARGFWTYRALLNRYNGGHTPPRKRIAPLEWASLQDALRQIEPR